MTAITATARRTVALAASAALTAALLAGCGTHGVQAPRVSTFTDKAGRVCTQSVTAHGVALSCSFKPIENRAGSLLQQGLEKLRQQASPSTVPQSYTVRPL